MRPNDRSSGYMYYPRDLYHYGVIGMEWGKRRYQNRDGSLTPLGREHYGRGKGEGFIDKIKNADKKAIVSKAKEVTSPIGKMAAKGAQRLGEGIARGVKQKLAQKAPWMLRDEELAEFTQRLQMEKSYKQVMADKKRIDTSGPASKFVGEILTSGAKTIANKGFNKLADKMFGDKDETTDYMSVLRNPAAFTDKQVKAALDRQNNLNAIRDRERSREALNPWEVSAHPENFTSQQIQEARNHQDNLSALRRSLTANSRSRASDILNNPDNYSSEDIQAEVNRQNNLNALRDSARGRSGNTSNNAREIVSNPDDWTDQQIQNALKRQQNLTRLRDLNRDVTPSSSQNPASNTGASETSSNTSSGQRYQLNTDRDLTDYSSELRRRRQRNYDRHGRHITT